MGRSSGRETGDARSLSGCPGAPHCVADLSPPKEAVVSSSRNVFICPLRVICRPIVNQTLLEKLRREEIDLVRHWFKPGMRVLELGGGNGFQAQILAAWGCEVMSVDLPAATIAPFYYPVQAYDGQHLPFPDHSFDAIFSSNVLEHISHLQPILNEIARVVKTDGVIVHILPSSAWRFWTSLSHYGHISKRAVGLLFSVQANTHASTAREPFKERDWPVLLKRALFDGPHGEYPNALYELYAFSRSRWLGVFRAHGFAIIACRDNGLFYTGYGIFSGWSLATRRALRWVLGPAARIYVMRPVNHDLRQV